MSDHNQTESAAPCPFCGVDLVGDVDDGASFHTHPENDCFFSTWEFDQLNLAQWNRRPPVVGEDGLPALPSSCFKFWNADSWKDGYTAEQVRQAQREAREYQRKVERKIIERRDAEIAELRALIAHINAWGARMAGVPFDLGQITRWTFDGGMTATVAKDGQWIAYKDLAWRVAAPAPQADKEDGICGS